MSKTPEFSTPFLEAVKLANQGEDRKVANLLRENPPLNLHEKTLMCSALASKSQRLWIESGRLFKEANLISMESNFDLLRETRSLQDTVDNLSWNFDLGESHQTDFGTRVGKELHIAYRALENVANLTKVNLILGVDDDLSNRMFDESELRQREAEEANKQSLEWAI